MMTLQDKANILLAYKVDKTARAVNNNSVSYELSNVNKIFVDTRLQVNKCMLNQLSGEIEALVSIIF